MWSIVVPKVIIPGIQLRHDCRQ